MNCIICGNQVQRLLELSQDQQVTSLGRLIDGQGTIYSCAYCSHCQTNVTISTDRYYATDYKTLMHSHEEDDLYKIIDNRIVYRSTHMANTFLRKMKITSSLDLSKIRLLDFGCGKGLFSKEVCRINPAIHPFLYDVSEDYVPCWEQFCSSSNYSCFNIPSEWTGTFDVVTSMFSMEHVPDPLHVLSTLRSLLVPNGLLYIVVPNMYSENFMDMIVVDHLHHFSPTSMKAALALSGFFLIEEDHETHEQASIYIAQATFPVSEVHPEIASVHEYLLRQKEIACSFDDVSNKVNAFADSVGSQPIVIIGAGIIGSFVKSILSHSSRIACFVDSNPFKQQKGWQSLPVISPNSLAEYDEINSPSYIIAHNPRMLPIALNMIPKTVPQSKCLILF